MSAPKFFPRGLKHFTVNWAEDHKTFIIHRVLIDNHHPLHVQRKQVHASRKKTGLWWHVTVGPNTSRARVVRSWARRRLGTAFAESLKERGIARDGTISPDFEGRPYASAIREKLEKGEPVSLVGSLKLHALAPLVPAKFEQVKEETSALVDALLKGLENDLKWPNNAEEGRFARSNYSKPSVGQWTLRPTSYKKPGARRAVAR